MILRTAPDSLAAVRFGAPGRLCGATLLTASRIPICTACLARSRRSSGRSARCGRPFPIAPAAASIQPICRLCRDDYYTFDLAHSYGVYNDALHQALLLLKYEEVTRLGDWFAARLAEPVAREPERFRAGVVAPVPPHRDRQRERGYNLRVRWPGACI